jgi:hypothetical protein
VPGTADDRVLKDGAAVPEGWLVAPHDGVGLTAADVVQIVDRGIATANRTRAAIRLPLDSRTRMTFSVTDATGAVLGLYRMPDATTFSDRRLGRQGAQRRLLRRPGPAPGDRSDPGPAQGCRLQQPDLPLHRAAVLPRGPGQLPARPVLVLNDGGHLPGNPLNAGPPLPASAFQSVQGYDAFHPRRTSATRRTSSTRTASSSSPAASRSTRTPTATASATWSAASASAATASIQDDVVTFFAAQGFEPPSTVSRADQVFVRGVRLPYQKFNRNPFG